MNSKLICIIIAVCISISSNAQDSSKWSLNFQGELPSIWLSGDRIESQQFNLGMGYLATKNLSVSLNLGSGLIGGLNSTSNLFFGNFTQIGLNTDYMVNVNKVTKLGIELAASSAFTNGKVSNPSYANSRFMNYQGGFKVENENVFAILGLRNRQFKTSDTDNTELYYAIGYKFSVFRKAAEK